MGEQWDVGRALAVSGLFRALQGAGRACAAPFLTLYLRHLGLPAPLVGVVAGAQQLAAALWTALCPRCPRGRGKRRLLVAGSALGSAGAGLLLTLVPPAARHAAAAAAFCNASQQPGHRGAATAGPGLAAGSRSPLPGTGALPAEAMGTTAALFLLGSGRPALAGAASQPLSGLAGAPEDKGDTKTSGYLDGPSGWTAAARAGNWETQQPETLPASGPPDPGLEKEMSSLGSAAMDPAESAEESSSVTERDEPSAFATTLPALGAAYVSGNLSERQQDAADLSFEALQNVFQDGGNQVFLMVLGAVVVWELLATSLERTVDESLYQYLDFVDATDRYGRLWIWSHLGASAGACSISVLVDRLSCSLGGSARRLALHFYGYAALVTLSLLVSAFFPIHVPKKPDRVNRAAKALALLWSEGRAFLCALTLFLTGAACSALHNFLFWQLEDRGSSELYMGLSVAAGLLAELLLYFFKGKLLRTFSSSKIVAASLSLLAVQLLCYSFLWAAWPVLLLQTLSAFSSGALWWVADATVDDVAAPGTERSLRAVLRGLFQGGGASLGSLAGGFVVQRFGLAVLYRACSLAVLLWLFCFLIVQSKLPRQKKINYSRLLAADSSEGSDSEEGEEDERDWLVKAMKEESFNRGW
ncbi:major facilitator superfamily domain-containing protein 6-like [Melanerpes formicivorus]|uniref:major facilitator superfamily domain-containing protein 6-like n=1 Tax=Melanerpes formicivorus TaxID=211600 RepID=UPI00358E13B4